MMATQEDYSLKLLFLIIIIISITGHKRTEANPSDNNNNNCDIITFCGKYTLPIEFPFWIKSEGNNNRCGYPGFDVKCNKQNQSLLNLPKSGDFVVKAIEKEEQQVWINDPEECLPRKIMLNRGFSLADSPFQLAHNFFYQNFSFYNCPYEPESRVMITCLGLSTSNNVSYSVVAVLSSEPPERLLNMSACHLITWGLAPVPSDIHEDYWTMSYVDIQLQWNEPDCRYCLQHGGRCGLPPDSSTNHHAACYDLPHQHQGLSRKVRLGLAMGLGIPGFIGIIGLICLLKHIKIEEPQQSSRTKIEFSIRNVRHPQEALMGLDGPFIEKYPKTEVGESGQLSRPNDTICSICLCEYRSKEMLRIITECEHYFLVDCIDGWLKMNATCPLCRKLTA